MYTKCNMCLRTSPWPVALLPRKLVLDELDHEGPDRLGHELVPWAFGWTPSRSMPDVKPAAAEQSATRIGESVEFCAATQAGMAELMASMPAGLSGRGDDLVDLRVVDR